MSSVAVGGCESGEQRGRVSEKERRERESKKSLLRNNLFIHINVSGK